MNTFAIINIARQQLDLDEDTYRALLERVTGKSSLRQMSERERSSVVDELKRKGFRIRRSGKALPPSTKPYVRLIHALWTSCARYGVIETGSREALRAFCKRFIAHGVDAVAVDPDMLSYDQATPIIEALKRMEARGKALSRG
ncbi:regulatory protein GemA [Sinirhodobacter ferrireducens]|uniref:Regulatory protein GemA n=1 Tax=Paenirhodobacter ferrireducens TaxID=1215032 RepID=A0A443LN79_9RHOB|nr:regulatory protein GemA [Sinirhodobacter ferrireducens]RWR50620.1 regulatory protein GemA [Sinirhodobacter ferrireducens]